MHLIDLVKCFMKEYSPESKKEDKYKTILSLRSGVLFIA